MKFNFISFFFNIHFKGIFSIFLFTLLLLPFSSFRFIDSRVTRVIVIDPGHGGKDTGALGKNCREKDIVLAISLKLGKLIEENFTDVKVIYTRSTDEFIELNKRAEIANNNHADLFISIHANSIKKTSILGTETFVMGLHKTEGNLEVAMKENAVITFEDDYSSKYEGYDPNSAESFIIFSLLQNTFLEQSLKFATIVQSEFKEKAQRIDRGVKQAGFLVLWNTTMPSSLIEVGFISHTEEEKFLISQKGQDLISSALYRSVRTYFSQMPEKEVQHQRDTTNNINNNNSISKTNLLPEDNGVYFKIQISSSSTPVPTDSPLFKGLKGVEENFMDNMYKYTFGSSKSFKEIKKVQKKILLDFPDAFIIAIQKGMRITLKEAINQSDE